MALIKCPECNKKFSEYANECPNCACPTHIVKMNIEINIQNKKQKLYYDAVKVISKYKNINELYKAKENLNYLSGFKDSIAKIEEINDLIVFEKNKKIYNKDVNIISNYKSIDDLYNAKNILKSIDDFKDSFKKIEEIEKKINNEEYAEKQKIYNKANNIISNYKHINELYEAKRLFKLLNGFKDSSKKIKYIERYVKLQKQKLYDEAIEIIFNYKTIDDLHNAEKKLQELDDFKDSYKKIEEIKTILNFENECKKINIKEFVKIIVIIILICLSMYLLVDRKINRIKPNDFTEEREPIIKIIWQ